MRRLALVALCWAGRAEADAVPATTVAVTDSTGQWVGITNVGGAKALKVDVIQSVSSGGGLTDAQLRANAVPVSGSFWQATQPVSGSLTCNAGSGTLAVSGPLTDAQIRASALPVSGSFWQATQPVSGSFWQTTQPVSGTFWQATQPVSGSVTANVGTTNGLALDATLTGGTQKTKLVDSGGTNVATVSAGGAVKVDGSAATQPVSGTFWQATQPVSGTFWQATQPVSGTVTANAGSGTMAVSGTFWQATQPVSGTVAATQSGTWTVQPGNTANTTAWKVDGSAVTQPVSGTVTATANQNGTWTVQPGNTPNTSAWLVEGPIANNAAPGTSKPMQLAGYAWTDGTAPSATTAGNVTRLLTTTDGRLVVSTDHPKRVSCRITSSATSSTVVTGCAAPGAGLSIYVTDISVYGGVATGATAAASIQYGTGGTCGTPTIIYDCQHPATGGCEAHYTTPKKAAANAELCVVDATVGTKFVSVSGYIAP